MLVGLQSVGHVVQVCLEGCYVGDDVVESSVKLCVVEFVGKCCGWVCKYSGCLRIYCDGMPCWLVAKFEHFGKGCDEIVCDVFGAGTVEEDMYSSTGGLCVAIRAQILVVCDSLCGCAQYGC